MIIGITGTLAAGKGTIVDFLIEQGFKHYSVRYFLIEEIKKRGLPVNRDSMVIVANQLREINSASYIVEQLYHKARIAGGDCIIESLRAPGEIKALKEQGDFYLIGVDADIQTRYERAVLRDSETDKISFEEFFENEERESFDDDAKQNLRKCLSMADFILENNGTIEELKEKVKEILCKMKCEKRENYISWDEYFMGVAILSGKRSKDPNTQVGACIVDENKKIVGVGYNGFPKGCKDEELSWSREGKFLNTKYPYVVHGELNAILNSIKSLKNCTIYVALFPCNECAKAIVQSGIKKVVYLSDKYKEEDSNIAAKRIFNLAGVNFERMIPKIKNINLEFE